MTMKRSAFALAFAAALSIPAIAVHAESPDPSGQFAQHVTHGKSAAQVRAELFEAQRNGDIVLSGEIGLTERQLHPGAFPAGEVYAGKSAEQVRAETLQAIRSGDILAPGESGLTLRQENPQLYLAHERGVQRNWFARHGHGSNNAQ
jgi:hypothetical protein